jgi:PAS domain S-box-containing protein
LDKVTAMVKTFDVSPLDSSLTQDAQYRLLVEAVTDYAIYMLDPDGLVMSWNSGAARFKGYRTAEILGKSFSLFYTAEDQAKGEPAKALEIATREGRFESEGWRIRQDGSRFWASVVVSPIRSADRVLLGFAKITRDITRQREAQRDRDQAQAALVQAQKMDAIGQLTSGIAHDFNNLLTAILISLELVRKRVPNDPAYVPLIDNAILGAVRGASLTKRMLAFARQQELNWAPINLPRLIEGMIDLLQTCLGPSITISTHLPQTARTIVGDPQQLELALLNLALNARDSMAQGGVVTISVREEDVAPSAGDSKAGQNACISVSDSGEGMDEATLSRAIEPFYTTKGPGKGTGLGLSMVHGIVTQSGGRLVLNSAKGHGTTAELWFPLEKRFGKGLSDPIGAAAPAERVPTLRVLAVDDDNLVLMTVVAMLKDLGHTVFAARSGRQALEIIRGGAAIELMVTDQAMPEMTGSMLAESVREELPNLRIILATGYNELSAGTGVDLVKLPKPFRQDDLERAILEALREKQQRDKVLPF